MKKIKQQPEQQDISAGSFGRRTFLAGIALTGIGFATTGLAGTLEGTAVQEPQQPEAETGKSYPMAMPNAKTEKEFRMGVAGPANLSLITSRIAVGKATGAGVKEFSNFELREAIGVTSVLKSLGTAVPPMDANAKATLEKIKSAARGAAFDKEYIKAQLANHEFLRDLAKSFLKNSAGTTSMTEMHGRHLATLALGTFKEHVVHTKKLLSAMS